MSDRRVPRPREERDSGDVTLLADVAGTNGHKPQPSLVRLNDRIRTRHRPQEAVLLQWPNALLVRSKAMSAPMLQIHLAVAVVGRGSSSK